MDTASTDTSATLMVGCVIDLVACVSAVKVFSSSKVESGSVLKESAINECSVRPGNSLLDAPRARVRLS